MSVLREGTQMALMVSRGLGRAQLIPSCSRTFATTRPRVSEAAAAAALDVEEESIKVRDPDPSVVEDFRTEKRLSQRDRQLPGNRYQYHPPKYDRGPLHPIQSPPHSDPVARNFMAGPFNIPRLKQTYETTISSDLLTLAYNHVPPGTPSKPTKERLRKWEGESPYFEGRPLRGPRGHDNLLPREKPITPTDIPAIHAVHINCYYPRAVKDRDMLYVARSVIQSISGRVPRVTWVKTGVVHWGTRPGADAGCKVDIFGDQAYEFVDKLINLVLPKIKDYEGMKAGGDRTGNIGFGFSPAEMVLFPEIETTYDMYPQKSIPGADFIIETTAKSDRQAMLLLSAMGLPFLPSSWRR